ncbi:hypothetical protein, partial [Sansalvadorimonas verongulae]|uniref:hypothetical protein n=1 Tax=Sansalvadorimonas verongulae TaxID=2172824 RepID=UPI001E51BD81
PILITDKGPEACMDTRVFGEVAGCGKRFVAPVPITDKGSDPCVNALVVGKIAGCGERFVALVTDVGPVPCVNALVSGEIAGSGKRFVASVLATDKGLFPCVGALAGGETTGLGERLVASALFTDSHRIFFNTRSYHMPPGDVRGPLIAVRLSRTHFRKSAICIECTLPCTGTKNTLKYIILQQTRQL